MAGANTDFQGDGFGSSDDDDYFVGTLPTPSALTGDEDLTGPLNEAMLLQSGLERDRIILTSRTDLELDNGFTLSLLGGYFNEDRVTGSDSAPLGTLFGGFSLLPFTERESENYSVEFRVESPRDQRVRYTFGAFYFKDELVEFGSSYPGLAPFTPLTPVTSVDQLDRSRTRRETENWALFGMVNFDITERLTANVEVRYSEDEKFVVGDRFLVGSAPELNRFPAENTFTDVSFRILTEYEFNDDFLGYASISRGNKPGGFNDANNRDPQPIFPFLFSGFVGGDQLPFFEEETSLVWEAGFKSSWLDDRVIVNASFFRSRDEDVQLTQTYAWCTVDPDCGFFLPFPPFFTAGVGVFNANANIINIPKVERWGTELEVTASITEKFLVRLGYAYVDSEIKQGTSRDHGRLFPPHGDAAATGPQANIAGLKFPRISDHQFNFAGTYTQPMSFGEVYLNMNGAYESERFTQVSNLAVIPEAFTLNFRAGARYKDFEIAAWGKNILDEDAPVDSLRFRDGDFVRAFQLANRKGAAFGIEVIADWTL